MQKPCFALMCGTTGNHWVNWLQIRLCCETTSSNHLSKYQKLISFWVNFKITIKFFGTNILIENEWKNRFPNVYCLVNELLKALSSKGFELIECFHCFSSKCEALSLSVKWLLISINGLLNDWIIILTTNHLAFDFTLQYRSI